jgi:hypothetical protein
MGKREEASQEALSLPAESEPMQALRRLYPDMDHVVPGCPAM